MADLLTEELLSLSQAARLLPAGRRAEGTANPATLWRWARDGVKTPNGERLKLQVVRAGGHWLTSRQAVARFIEALTAAKTGEVSLRPAPRTPGQRGRAAERAAKRLQRIGI